MIIQTTPEIAEGLFEHLLIMKISDFEIKVSRHKLIDQSTKVFFTIESLGEEMQDKLLNLIELYNQLIPDQQTQIASYEDLTDTQDFWTPVKDFSIGFSFDSPIRLKKKIGFGIGLHPSTILTLRALEEKLKSKKIKTFVDIGSGSGILSIFTAKKGIEEIIAFEIQDEAINAMKENFYLNNLDSTKIIFNPYITEEERKEDIRDAKTILNTTNELIFETKIFEKALFAANMRPAELKMCKDILSYSKKTIISGLMNGEENPIDINKEKELIFGDWRCEY